jgi:hypothetical protein
MEYPGPWLPEPLAEPNQDSAELASSLNMAFLVLLQQLAPLGYAGKLQWSESDFQLVTINGTPGVLMRHPLAGDGAYSFDIVDGRIRTVYVVRNPDKLRVFLDAGPKASGRHEAQKDHADH